LLVILAILFFNAEVIAMIAHGNPSIQKIWAGARYVGIEQYREYKGWWADTGKWIEPDEWAVSRAIRRRETSLNEEIRASQFSQL
jgi:hypothetical protein